MNAAARKLEVHMSIEERVANIESDMGQVRSTLADIKNDTRSMQGEVREFRGGVASARAEAFSLRTDIEKRYWSLRVEMEKESASIRVWMLKTIGGAVAVIYFALWFGTEIGEGVARRNVGHDTPARVSGPIDQPGHDTPEDPR